MSQEKQVFSIDLAGRQLTVETGQLAKQANGAVLVDMAIQRFYLQQLHQKKQKM